MRTVGNSAHLATVHEVEQHLDFKVWHLAHILHDLIWLPNQTTPAMRETNDGDYLKKRNLPPGTLINIAQLTFPLLPLDYQLKNIDLAVDILLYRQYWQLKNPNGTEQEFAESNAIRQHLAAQRTGSATEFKKPFEELTKEQQELNRSSGGFVQYLNDPTIFIGGTVGENQTGYTIVQQLRTVYKEYMLVHANLPKGASWHAFPRMYEEAAKREASVLLYVIGSPDPKTGNLSTYTPIEIQNLIHIAPERLIVYFDFDSVRTNKRSEETLTKLLQDDWRRSNAYAVFTPQEALLASQKIIAERNPNIV
jgi:hypothetical protein